MNNRTWIHRIAKGKDDVGIGPYHYLDKKIWEKDGYSYNDIALLDYLIRSKERWSGTTFYENIKNSPIYQIEGCFSSFKIHRPGPWDDPLLKQNLRKTFINREILNKELNTRSYIGFYGFDSNEQLNTWFNDDKENSELRKFGFTYRKLQVDTRFVYFGLKQVWVMRKIVE